MHNYIHEINDWMEMISSTFGVPSPPIYQPSFSHDKGLDNVVINNEDDI